MNLREIADTKTNLMRKEFPRGVFEYTSERYALKIGVISGKISESIIKMSESIDVNLRESYKVEEYLKLKNILEQNIAKLIIELSALSSSFGFDLDTTVAKELNLPTKES